MRLTELGVHEWLLAQLTTLLTVLHPEQFECDATAGQLLGYFLKVWHPAQ